jgi:hypothetical protein
VWEENGGIGTDTCHFSGSIYEKFDRITEGHWLVGSDNLWGPDHVGWSWNAVMYYRSHERAPCDTYFWQHMYVSSPGGGVRYVTNLLRAGITNYSVWSERAGQYAERVWP